MNLEGVGEPDSLRTLNLFDPNKWSKFTHIEKLSIIIVNKQINEEISNICISI